MPIWESEYSPTAIKYQAQLTRTALGLQQHFASLGARATKDQQTARKYMENAIQTIPPKPPRCHGFHCSISSVRRAHWYEATRSA
jgi:hypothetical protein